MKITEPSLLQHVEEFISTEVLEAVDQLSSLPNTEELKVSLAVAKELRDTIATIEVLAGSEETVALAEEARIQQIHLEKQLQDSLTSLQVHIFDSVEEISPIIDKELVKKVANVITHLQEDLKIATITSTAKTGMGGKSNVYFC